MVAVVGRKLAVVEGGCKMVVGEGGYKMVVGGDCMN